MGVSFLWLECLIKALEACNVNAFDAPYTGVTFPSQVSTWSDVTPAERGPLLTQYAQIWFAKYGAMTPAQFEALSMNSGFSATDPTTVAFGEFLIYMLRQLQYWGVANSVLQPVVA
jgi:hypothetical protein